MCLLLRSSSFWFERLVEWARLDEGLDFYHGSLQQMQICWRCWWLLSCLGEQWGPSYRVCCALSLLISKGCISFEILRTSLYQSRIKSDTHTHMNTHNTPLPVPLRSDTAAHEKSKHSHSLKRTHGHAHASFSTAPRLLKTFQTCSMSCQSHSHSYLQMPADGGKDCLFLFKQVITHTHTV